MNQMLFDKHETATVQVQEFPSFTTCAKFDGPASERAKDAGQNRAAANSVEILAEARKVAREIAKGRTDGITADDVVKELCGRGHDIHYLGNAAGSLFRGPEWTFTGERRKSARVHAHANELKVWRLDESKL